MKSKKNAIDIYRKNHPNTHDNLFQAFKETESEYQRDMYFKKNQEYSTLSSYHDYFQKQKELEDRLAEKYGFRKNDDIVFPSNQDPSKKSHKIPKQVLRKPIQSQPLAESQYLPDSQVQRPNHQNQYNQPQHQSIQNRDILDRTVVETEQKNQQIPTEAEERAYYEYLQRQNQQHSKDHSLADRERVAYEQERAQLDRNGLKDSTLHQNQSMPSLHQEYQP